MKRTPTTRIALMLTAALLGSAANAQSTGTQSTVAQSTVTMTAAVTAALTDNADVKTAQANLEKAQAANAAAQADPGSLVAARLSAKNAAALALAQLRGARLSTLQNTLGAYTTLLEAQENVQLQTLQSQVDAKALQVARVKQSIGNATALDVTNAQNTLASSGQTLADGRAQVTLASARLVTLTGLGSGLRAAGAPTVPRPGGSLGALQGSVASLSTLVSAQGDLALAQLNVKLADNDFTPARTLQDARTALANAQRSLDSAGKSAGQSLASAWQSVQSAYDLLGVAQSREAAAQRAATQDAARLRSGTISAVELLNTQLSLRKAQFSRLQAQNNVLEALAALSVAAGQNLTGIGGSL
ncbi:TolC family protein [Deinococcus koreensis]|uniref:TolC family protein n=1 Tax=Deinococcus koreensis TaxID=2054903 RepID=A0A2K3UT28_9DEIO|nr:TolC family protein [Deinococcus koreensis]PNY79694.1 TolC family protein [Deinococcus koreensis]